MNSHPPARRAANIGSILLTPQENECLFGYLGRKCAVYGADRSCCWVKKCCGVACLVKDNPQRSYYIRVFDIKEGKTMFEQELYHNFSISSSRSYFISFTGDNCQIGLNFASEEEAKRFRAAINDLLNRRQRKTGPALHIATVDIKNPEINNSRFHNSHSQQQPYHLNNMLHRKDKKAKASKKKKLTKADIGTPSNFQHIGHVGWDPNTGFDLNNLDPELKNLFDMCGISEAQLKDRETSKVIYDFIEKKGGVEAKKKRRVQKWVVVPLLLPLRPEPRPQLLPLRLPPDRELLELRLLLLPPIEEVIINPLLLPIIITTINNNLLLLLPHLPLTPLPPHKPRPFLLPQCPSSLQLEVEMAKTALLDQIRGGTQLKKVEQNNRAPATGVGRDALLDQIRQGMKLKNVPDQPESGPLSAAPSAGIVGALMEVMQKRSKAIHSSDKFKNICFS
ncbi:Neural Wiskott-Aldrich syndrome protein [Dissostichus eleginoides]|uniref:Neural Wiskott-Aldrich syndrome protein n=1 Tax=Dissostichus eleginoides TaxID=100907 RepID=A0AAD9BTZ0_DISEL|nr:Neural Wiskott-Aldrich syndrome protein [Dissostichus eleginoides]